MRRHRTDPVADHRQRPVAEEVDLHQPRIFGPVFLELDDGDGKIGDAVELLRRDLGRDEVVERPRRQHHATGME